jgi:starvation-inducible DNA-binding protein
MEKLVNAAKIGLASSFSFYLKAQHFHWNVEGPDFLEYHDLFGKIYDEVYGSIDSYAEKIRALGGYAPSSLSEFAKITQIEDQLEVLPKEQMVLVLLEDNRKMLKIFKIVYDFAEAEGEHGFSNFLAERMDAHRKHGWMLSASMKGQGQL